MKVTVFPQLRVAVTEGASAELEAYCAHQLLGHNVQTSVSVTVQFRRLYSESTCSLSVHLVLGLVANTKTNTVRSNLVSSQKELVALSI